MRKFGHTIVLITINLWLVLTCVHSQDVMRMKVEDVLVQAESNYQVRFSYSKDIVPYDQMVTVDSLTRSLDGLLEQLETQTGIIHIQRGSRVVLNFDPTKIHVQNQRNEVQDKPTMKSEDKLEESLTKEEVIVNRDAEREELVRLAPLIKTEKSEDDELRSEQEYQEALARLQTHRQPDMMQFSIVPLPHSTEHKSNTDYHISFNALAGYNGGVEGLELGLFLNGIRNDVFGIQLAGLANYVGGNVEGGQAAGFVNYNQGIVRGVQLAGFANLNDQAHALQLAGAFNLNQRVSRGVQLAGFFNAGRHITGAQMSGFFNLSVGEIGFQGSGFCNVAEKVDGQLSGLLNIAREVDHLQIGLINIADTVGGASIGLVNIVRKGYNALEISGGEALYGNLSLKLGTRKFYNVFQGGSTFRRNLDDTGLTWAVGYGFGFFTSITEKVSFNPEVVAMHVQETSFSNLELNLLSQAKFLFHFSSRPRGALEYFAGPVLNVSVSELYDTDRGIYGSQIMPYTLWEHTDPDLYNPVTTKIWIGFNAGIRM